MFTGIIEAIGKIAVLARSESSVQLCIVCNRLDLSAARVGDSIAVSGVCLTATVLDSRGFCADVSAETLSCTTFATLAEGTPVNLELPLMPASRLGGHLVSGHVDGVGEVSDWRAEGASMRVRIRAPAELARYIAVKGSICVDGVSLTVNTVNDVEFEVNLIPHTLHTTTLGEFGVGRRVNLEVDLVARYLERLLGDRSIAAGPSVSGRAKGSHADQ